MKKLIALAVLALLGFYIAWPAWTGYRIRQAFETQDAALLESKIDFSSVRASLKPVVAAEAEAGFERLKQQAGPLGGLIAGTIKNDVMGRLVDSVINSAITPPNVIRMVREGRGFKQSLERILSEQAGVKGGDGGGGLRLPGGLGGRRAGKDGAGQPNEPPKEEQVATQPAGAEGGAGAAPRPRMSLANIKSFALDGPLAFSVGVAKDATAAEPEVVATLQFTGTDWKVVAITPDFAGRRANRRP